MRTRPGSEVVNHDRRRLLSTGAISIAAAGAAISVMLAVSCGTAISAQDKYTVQVPNGLAFSEFRGFEDWQTVAVSQAGDLIEVILANPVMIDAYRAGVPGNGTHFPDGSKMAKIHWNAKKSAEAPAPTIVPDTLHDIDFMVRDSKRFPDTGAWGYAQFNHDAGSDTFTPEGSGTNCGYACHTIVAAKDYVFTAYGKR
jgi:Cytochrome P460